MNTFLLWLVPPAAGAAIGYITNALAVKMLFRPLRAYHIGGRRLPFTPGIIPRNRHKLAINIAAMVEKQLLSSEVIKARCDTPEFRAMVENTLVHIIENMIKTYADKLESEIGASAQDNSFFSFFNTSAQTIKKSVALFLFESLKRQVLSQKQIDAFTDTIIEEIPELVVSLDIQTTVREQIDAMELRDVERIVLSVMADQLTWINIFGALLGAIIGVFEALLTTVLFRQ
ncbi:MAG: DUF445 family protein [Spirochaetaceae bacterium]|jgi:uncharacterized membrane protein YheB (UPF0754 family)|nr:DUF445 family protein [Spirochaetaceae bacterium]